MVPKTLQDWRPGLSRCFVLSRPQCLPLCSPLPRVLSHCSCLQDGLLVQSVGPGRARRENKKVKSKTVSYREEAAQIEVGKDRKRQEGRMREERGGLERGQGRVVARPFMARTRRGRQGVSPGT